MPEFFEQARENFTLYGADARGWRPPQLGAIGATMAHWSLGETEPTVVSIPTGAGKTAVGMAAPFLHDHAPERVLVLSPSRQLREQLAEQFASLDQLRRVGVLSDGAGRPNVMQMAGRTDDWQSLRAFDVVVALPNSVSPVHYGEDEQPPDDLFDLIIVDEAHHAPAKTWRAILDHFPRARKLLLTATPRRRDGRRIPGSLRYYYPLRKALEEGLYNPITPHLLSVPEPNDRSASDLAVANRANDLLQQAAHTTSCLLVRGGTITRLEELQEIYKGVGIDLAVLHNRLSPTTQREIVERLSGGDLRAIGVVGMLGEGFDLPALRIAAYHDKHRSVPATVQLIGRLARVDPAFPQQSALITVADAEVYPELKGILKSLYEEDSDWAEVLPGILDEEIRQEHEDREFAEKLSPSRTEIDPLHLQPVKRAFV